MDFRPAREVHDEALRIAERERIRLAALVRTGELRLTGASSLPSLLTSGDVDLHLRVPSEDFAAAVEAMRGVYDVVHPATWTDGFATFETGEHALRTGIAVTAIGDEHDELFRRTWARIAADADAARRYDELKRAHAGADPDAYRAAKSAFFASIDAE